MKNWVKGLLIILCALVLAFSIYFFLIPMDGSKECKADRDCVPVGDCSPGCWNKNFQPKGAIWNKQFCGLEAPKACGCIENTCVEDYGPYVAKIINVTGGDVDAAANYYEGELEYSCLSQNCKVYIKVPSLFVCTQDWSWVKIGACYEFNDIEIQKNILSHKTSAELSGCYVGSLREVNCI
jgi:hypothetical protein